MWGHAELVAELKMRTNEKNRIAGLRSQEDLVREWESHPPGSIRWGWRCECGHVIRGTQTKSGRQQHQAIKAHRVWLGVVDDEVQGPPEKKRKPEADDEQMGSGSCTCKSACATGRCPCRKASRLCTSECHKKANSKCANVAQSASLPPVLPPPSAPS